MIKILHIDDNADDRELIRFRIARVAPDFHFAEARNAQEALSLLPNQTFDCILSDFQMPGMDGLNLLKVIRANEITIPFIFLTGQGNEALAAEALRAGADDYFRKDDGFAHYERLTNSVRRHVEAQRQSLDKRVAERRLFESEERYRLIFSRAPVGILQFDAEGIIIEANDALAQIMAVTRAQLIGFNLFTRVRDNELRSAISRSMAGERAFYEGTYESVLSGKKVDIRAIFERILSPDGRIIGGVGLCEDLEQVREAEQVRRRSEQLLRSAIESSLDALYILKGEYDSGGNITDFRLLDLNSRAEQQFGLERSALIGHLLSEFIEPPRAETMISLFREVMVTGKSLDEERQWSGNRIGQGWYHIQVVPLGEGVAFTARDITARRQVRRELEVARAQLDRVVSLAPMVLYSVRADGSNRITFISDTIATVLGYSKETVLSESFEWAANLHPDDVPAVVAKHEQLARDGTATANYRFRNAQGEYRWIRDEMRQVCDPQGVVQEWVGFFSDVTELRQVKEHLQREQENFRTLFDAIADAVVILDQDSGMILEANSAALELYGYTRAEFLGLLVTDISAEPEESLRLLSSPRPLIPRRLHRRKDGRVFAVEITSTLIDYRGRRALICTNRDIAIRDQARLGTVFAEQRAALEEAERARVALEHTLHLTEQKYESLLSASPDAITVTDLQGVISYVSPQALKLFGYDSIDAALGHNILEFTIPEEREVVKARLRERLQQDNQQPAVFRAIRADGSIFHQEVNGVVLRDENGAPTGLMYIARDVSQRVFMEQEQQRQQEQVEARNRDLEAFSYTVSHDLNAPLRQIRSYIDLLTSDHNGNLDEVTRQYFERINSAAGRMSTLIRDLLWFSRSGQIELSRQKIELGPLVHEILAGHARAHPARQYRAKIEPDLIVDADPSLMRVAMENLLSNAWKYTADRPIAEIEVYATKRDNVRGFCLRDNGIGFSPGDAKRIFEPFVRLHSDHRYEGTGIGLTTVRRIIERHGGTISADSVPGVGTTFFFSLEG